MNLELPGFALYVAIKYLAYTAWCYAGLQWIAAEHRRGLRRALGLGLVRLLLGVGVGLFIFLAALTMNNATKNAALTYLAIYVPVRIGEWTLLHWLVGPYRRDRSWAWIAGGVAVSCLADLPLALLGGGVVPVGRPFC